MVITPFLKIAVTRAQWHRICCTLGMSLLLMLTACSRNDTTPPISSNPLTGSASSALPSPASGMAASADRRWAQLSQVEQQVLAPLATEWDSLDTLRKKKWLEIATRYARLPAEEQQRLQTRMHEWTKLSPQQRRIARESYVRAKKLDAEQKSAKWESYKNLPDEEKKKLAENAEKKKNLVNLPRAKNDPSNSSVMKPVPPVLPSAPTEPLAEPLSTLPQSTAPSNPNNALPPTLSLP